MFASQAGENQGTFSKENLKRFAEEIGLDTKVFNECLDSGRYTQLVQNQTQMSQGIGVRSTPSFLVNGRPLVGAQPLSAFEGIFKEILGR